MQFRSPFEGPWSTPKDPYDIKTGEWRSQRPITKVEKCRQCGWCYIFCPSGCIEEREYYFAANLEYCKGCGTCSKVCPAKAIMLIREEV